jgi:hypothetical protein
VDITITESRTNYSATLQDGRNSTTGTLDNMTNKNYKKGRKKEYKIKKLLEKEGYIVLRSAGSHGFADLVAVRKPKEREVREIKFIQCKPENFRESERKKLLKEYEWLDGYIFSVKFEII